MSKAMESTAPVDGSEFELDVTIVESGSVFSALTRSTDDNCGSTCSGSACASGGGNV
ncbi:FxLD family lanthipeptide [Streptomyces sp. UNOC14_S4]|uniref:FxLD family lanthipeptide n=1 Tax=Streptomyces sp. UNOC14_S4 TaxID=2872340 RepID=UPI001E56D83D|nr:FxLD family lanthipeptide [Streptomyces sp. UNOC14_S4]MCC3767575.1 FxLD family lanthipeptide [Streptomyces sp. UNOC14_S4]